MSFYMVVYGFYIFFVEKSERKFYDPDVLTIMSLYVISALFPSKLASCRQAIVTFFSF